MDLADGPLILDPPRLLLDQRFDLPRLPDGWHIETGEWTPTERGLIGTIAGDSAAALWCGSSLPHELALVFEASAMPGHDSDANAFFHASGSIYGPAPNHAWIAGTAGWYVHDHGLERHPDGPTWRVRGTALVPGRTVTVAAGFSRGRLFLWKDGQLLLDRPEPTAAQPGPAIAGDGSAAVSLAADNGPSRLSAPSGGRQDRVGLGTWDSSVRFTRLRVYDLGFRIPGGDP